MVECLRTLAGGMAEKEASVPKIYSQVAGVAALAVDRSLMTLAEVAELAEGGRHYPLFLLTLQNLHTSHGKQQLSQLYNQSKVCTTAIIYSFFDKGRDMREKELNIF